MEPKAERLSLLCSKCPNAVNRQGGGGSCLIQMQKVQGSDLGGTGINWNKELVGRLEDWLRAREKNWNWDGRELLLGAWEVGRQTG